MIKLPNAWINVPLSDVAQWGSGGTPPRANSAYYGGDIPWVKTGELGQGLIKYTEENITDIGLQNSSAKIFPKGSVLIAMYGATIGKTAILGIDAATNQACAVGIPREGITTTEYLFHYLSSQKDAFIEAGKGAAQPNISQKILKDWTIPLASFDEQKRITNKLNSLIARVNLCRDRLDRVLLILKRFRKAVLASAILGQLTEDWREENLDIESAANLVKEKRFSLAASEDDLPLLPNNWEWVALGNYAQCSRGRFSVRPRNDPAFFNGEHPFIQIGDLPSEGGWVTTHKQTLNEKGLAVSKKFSKGTVAIAIVGSTIGNTGILAYDMCFTDSMIAIETGDEVSNQYVELFLRHRKEDIRQTSYAGGGQPNIKLEVLNSYSLALPPLEEQYEIVRRVEALFAYAARIEARHQDAYAQIEQLIPILLNKAFKGELVSQDPNDEPVSVLLARIYAERAAKPDNPKRIVTRSKSMITKMSNESVKEIIRKLSKNTFSFDELHREIIKKHTGNYDSIKGILFALLDETEPSIMQTFDQETKAMRFIRR